MDKYDFYNRKTKNVLIHECGWSLDNETGSWRSHRPEINYKKCNNCSFCWLYCPDGAIARIDGRMIINLKYCKGCGICANECPREAMTMVKEDE